MKGFTCFLTESKHIILKKHILSCEYRDNNGGSVYNIVVFVKN